MAQEYLLHVLAQRRQLTRGTTVAARFLDAAIGDMNDMGESLHIHTGIGKMRSACLDMCGALAGLVNCAGFDCTAKDYARPMQVVLAITVID